MKASGLSEMIVKCPLLPLADPKGCSHNHAAVLHLQWPGHQGPGARLQARAHHGPDPPPLPGLALLHAAPGLPERGSVQRQPPRLPHADRAAGALHSGQGAQASQESRAPPGLCMHDPCVCEPPKTICPLGCLLFPGHCVRLSWVPRKVRVCHDPRTLETTLSKVNVAVTVCC